jgi:FixJ family two-component response regulator
MNSTDISTIKIITYVLDDDIDELLLLKEPLQKVCGCDLEMFTDPGDFINAIDQGVHIAIIDFKLSAGVDGIEIGRQVLQKNKLAFLILFSGLNDSRVWQRATNVGFRGLVYKNDFDCYKQVSEMVSAQLDGIRKRIQEYEMLCTLNSKYEKHLQ